MRDLIFISYSHADKFWLESLVVHLRKLLGDKDLIWSDKNILPGDAFKRQIKGGIDAARIAVLLISAAYLDSDFITEHEFRPLVEAWRKNKVRLVWIPIEKTLYKHTPLKEIQAASDPVQPLDTLNTAECNQALEQISESIVAAFDNSEHKKTVWYYLNYFPLIIFGIVASLILGSYSNANIRLTSQTWLVLEICGIISSVWFIAIGFYARKAFRGNLQMPAPERFWSMWFHRLATRVGQTQRTLAKPKILIVYDQNTEVTVNQIKDEYEESMEITQFVCPRDLPSTNLYAQLKQADGLCLFRTSETEKSEGLWKVLKKWEVEETHKPILLVDCLWDDYKLPYTRIPETQVHRGILRLLGHGSDRAELWRGQATNYRRIWFGTMALVVFLTFALFVAYSRLNFKVMQNVYRPIATQTREEIKRRVQNQKGYNDEALNVSYWFPYQRKLYQLASTEQDPARSVFEADQDVDPSLIGCVFAHPNYSAQWDATHKTTAIFDWHGQRLPDSTCKFKSLPKKNFQSMVCVSYSPPGDVVVGICAFTFTDSKVYALEKEMVDEVLTQRARDYHAVVSELIRGGKLIPQAPLFQEAQDTNR